MVPVLLGVLISYAISNSLSVSIFDVLLDMKGLPYLPAIRTGENYALKAKNIMNRKCHFLYKNSKLSDIAMLLFHNNTKSLSRTNNIPVMKTADSHVLLFSVETQSLRKYLIEYYNGISHTFQGECKEKLKDYFNKINAISQSDIINESGKKLKELLLTTEHESVIKRKTGDRNEHGFVSIKDSNDSNSDPTHSDLDAEEHQSEQLERFWNTPIDWENQFLDVERAPFTVMEETPLAKVHFLFTMLNVSQIFVITEGILAGIITKNEFLRRTRDDEVEDTHYILPSIDQKHEILKEEIKAPHEHDPREFRPQLP